METPNLIELVIASKNVHKIRELKEMLNSNKKFDLLSLLDFPEYTPIEETGETFEENAQTKALHAAKVLNKLVIADDSGLVVPSLDGAPGIYSARYAGNNASDADNRKKLLSEMESMENDARNAYFKCCLAIATPQEIQKTVCGMCEGRIVEAEKGGSGFGYDPIFMKNDYNKTLAELESAVKNRISHRRKAIDKLSIFFESLQN